MKTERVSSTVSPCTVTPRRKLTFVRMQKHANCPLRVLICHNVSANIIIDIQNSCHGNSVKLFSKLWDNDYRIISACYTFAMVTMLIDYRPYYLHY
jgi:hypothetical protein